MVDELLSDEDVKRVVAFQNGEHVFSISLLFTINNLSIIIEVLAAFYPKVYWELRDNMEQLCDHHPNIKLNFPSHSAYPACGFNLGPSTVIDEHTDPGNCPRVPCAVTAIGPFDPEKGGHLVLLDLKLVIRFPPGSTILFSSASIRHYNIPIQRGEKRFSITQFCPGGLYRWVRHGFRPACMLTDAERKRVDGDPEVRWRESWDMLSTPESLLEDRRWLVEMERAWADARRSSCTPRSG